MANPRFFRHKRTGITYKVAQDAIDAATGEAVYGSRVGQATYRHPERLTWIYLPGCEEVTEQGQPMSKEKYTFDMTETDVEYFRQVCEFASDDTDEDNKAAEWAYGMLAKIAAVKAEG